MKKLLLTLATAAIIGTCGCSGAKNAPREGTVTTVGVEDFASIASRRGVVLIDVRTAAEYAEGHIDGAANIDVRQPDFPEAAREAATHGRAAVYCRSGKRSLKAADQLAGQGITVYNLDGGIMAWQQAGKPVAR